jgi:hypothetical protein
MAIAFIAFAFVGISGCSAESKAKDSLGKYEKVFKTCKDMTDEAKLEPGKHRCSNVASMAIEISLKNSGLEEAKWKGMLDAWLDKAGYRAYYLGPENRKD